MKNRSTAAILAFLLGGIGIHKFYLNQIFLGFLYLFFCWTFIPLLISLIEGVRFVLMDDDVFESKFNKAELPNNVECANCNTKLTFMTTPNFGGGKLKDGNRICRSCFKEIVRLDTRFGLHSKTLYDIKKVKETLGNPKTVAPRKKKVSSKKNESKTAIPTVSSLVETVKTVNDLKKLKKESERCFILFKNSGYENQVYEKLNRKYEEAYHKACNLVLYYQFVPHIELNSPKEIVESAFQIIEKGDYEQKRKQLGGREFDWNEITAGELEDSNINEIIEKPPVYWDTYLEFYSIISSDISYEEKTSKINNLAESDKSFWDEFFRRDTLENAGEQWVKNVIRNFGVPLVDTLFDLGYDTPIKIKDIDVTEISKVNGFGPYKIEQLKMAIEKIKKFH